MRSQGKLDDNHASSSVVHPSVLRAILAPHIDQNPRAASSFMYLDICAHIPHRDTKGFQMTHQIHLKVRGTIVMFYPKGEILFPLQPPPPAGKNENCSPYFQMCLTALLKSLGILMLNIGSDIKVHEFQRSAMFLIDVLPLF